MRHSTKRVTFLLLFISIFFKGEAQRLIFDENIPVEKIRVVLEQTQGGTVSEMLTDLEYIPLQTAKGDLIDRITDITILGDRVGVITNYGVGHFYLFALDGTLIKKISKIDGFKHENKNNKTLFSNMVAEDGKFVLSNYPFKAWVDTDGNILDTLTEKRNVAEREDGQYIHEQLSIRPDSTYYYYGTSYHDNRKRQDVLTLNDSVLIHYNPLDTNRTNFSMVSGGFSKWKNNKAYLSISQKTQIFVLGTRGIEKVYDIVFPLRNTIGENEILKYKDWQDFYKYIQANQDKVLEVGATMRYGEYLIFKVGRWLKRPWLVYHPETKAIYGLNNIVPDKSNDYLDFLDQNTLFVEGDYLYSFIYPNQLRQAKNKALDERHTISKATADLEKYNNPVLVRFKLK
ncbi:MAG TPA: 6-bladed beta-propeller [Sphingobacterium sp.]|nr:6-bladed beta-propeller [Sphingobacterium sp.]